MGAVEKPSSHTASRESGSSGARPGGAPEAPGLIWESLEHALEDLARDDEAPASAPAPTPARPEAIRTLREASVVLEALLHRALPVALPVHGPQALPLLIEQALVSGLGPALGVPAGDLEGSVAVRNRVLAHARALREGRLEPAPGADEVQNATACFQAAIESLDAHITGQAVRPTAPPAPAEPAHAPIPAGPIAATPAPVLVPEPAPAAAITFPAQATAELLIVPPPAAAPETVPARRPRRTPQWLKGLGSMAATVCFCALGVYAGTRWLDPNASLEVLRGRAEALCWEAQAYDPADGFSKAQDRVEALRREAQALYQVGRKDAVRRSYQEIIAHCETLSRLDRERQSARFARQRLQAREPESPALAAGEEAYREHLFARAEQIWTKSVPVSLANESGVAPARDSNAEPVSLTRAEGPAKSAPSPAPIADLEPALPEPAPPAPLPEVPPVTEPAAPPADIAPAGTAGASIPRPLPDSIAPAQASPRLGAKPGADAALAGRVDDARREMEGLKGRYGATVAGPGADESMLWSRAMDLGRQGTEAEAKGDFDTALVAYRRATAMLPEAHREAALALAKAEAESDRPDKALDILARLLAEGSPARPGDADASLPGVQPLFDQIAPRGLAWWLARAREQAGAVEDPAARALARVSVASVSREARDLDEAARAVEAIPDPLAKADACSALALARFRSGGTPEAAATLRRGIAALESAPNARWSHFAELVQAAGAIGDRDLWQACLDASFRARPKHEALAREVPGLTAAQYDQYWKAIYHLMYGEVTAARRIAEALGAQPELAGDPYLLCALARGAAALGDLDEARPLIEKASAKLQAATKLGEARRAECLAELALAYALAGRLDEAARWTSRMESASDSSRIYRVIAQQRARRGELAEAAAALDEITDPAERALAARSLASARCREGDWLRIARWSDALPATDLRAVALAAVADAVQPRRAASAQAAKADGEQQAAAVR